MKITPSSRANSSQIKDIECLKSFSYETKIIPKLFKLYFKMLFFTFSYDYGFFDCNLSLRQKRLLKAYSVLFQCFLVYNNIKLCLDQEFIAVIRSGFVSLHLVLLLLVSIINVDNHGTVYDLYSHLNTIDSALNIDTKILKCEIKFVIFNIAIFLNVIGCYFAFCYINVCTESSIIRWMLNLNIKFGLAVPPTVYALLFIMVHDHLKVISSMLDDGKLDIKTFGTTYKSIQEITKEVTTRYSRQYSVYLIVLVPSMLLSIFLTLSDMMKSQMNLQVQIPTPTYCFVALSCILIFLPALTAGKLLTFSHKLTVALEEKYYEEQDANRKKEIEDVIQYIKARPLRFTACKIFTLDESLIVKLFNVCVTYIIVIVQFTDLY